MGKHRARKRRAYQGPHQVTIEVLPDDVLLDIFDCCLNQRLNRLRVCISAWQLLVHVCRRWRAIVFQSPRRLNLQIDCTAGTPVREILDIWPALPFVISVRFDSHEYGMENVIAALEHRDRIHKISFDQFSSRASLGTILPIMQEPFPELKSLGLQLPTHDRKPVTCIPDSFLGGSAPHLQYLHLDDISFPALPKLLLSATDLVTLILRNVPHSGYISPETMVTALSALTSLESLELRFKSPESCPDNESRYPPFNCAVLPVLTQLVFQGASAYLEDVMARIVAAPLLDRLEVYFFNQPIFHTPHLSQFISHTPKFQALKDAQVVFFAGSRICVNVHSPKITCDQVITMGPVGTARGNLGWQPSSLAQLCVSSLTLFLMVEHLYLIGPLEHWRDIENTQWLEVLQPFTAVKNLYLSRNFAPCIAPALQELVGEGVAEVLPALKTLFLAGQLSGAVLQAIKEFVKARQLSNCPIAVSWWEQEVVGKRGGWWAVNDSG